MQIIRTMEFSKSRTAQYESTNLPILGIIRTCNPVDRPLPGMRLASSFFFYQQLPCRSTNITREWSSFILIAEVFEHSDVHTPDNSCLRK